MTDTVKPLLKYPGGKRKVALPLLREIGGDRKALVDLCCGAGAYLHAACRLGYTTLHAADASPLIQAWWWGSRFGDRCATRAKLSRSWPISKREYYDLRARVPDLTPSDIYLLNRAGYNGLSSFNRAGGYNVAYGKVTEVRAPDPAAVSEHFAVADAINRFDQHYADALDNRPVAPAVFVLDPPYLGGFTAYAPGGWYAADLERALRMTLRPGDVAVVHEHTGGEAQTLIERAGYRLHATWNRSGIISGDIDNRKPRQEGVWVQGGARCQ